MDGLHLQPVGRFVRKLDSEIDYTIPVPVLGKLAEKLVLKRNERESNLNSQNIKERMEG